MEDAIIHKQQLDQNGYTVIEGIYEVKEILAIAEQIDAIDTSGPSFRKSSDLFAIRQFLKTVPSIQPLIYNNQLMEVILKLLGDDYFLVKSIYFDKPEQSNWFVAYHQDLTISVDRKVECDGFNKWTIKEGQFSVQPPLSILENIFTIRIHLDDTSENNGALRVIPGSHLKGIYRPETVDWTKETEVSCNVRKGGVMIMRPLLLHASSRTANNSRRRVVHLEFSNAALPANMQWAEYMNIPF